MKIENDIIVYCAKGYGEKIYIMLLSIGCHVVAFCDNAKSNQNGMRLGLPVYDYQVCRMKYPQAVYVIANSTYATAIEIGMELEKDGYVKNVSYFISIELKARGMLSKYKEGVQAVLNNQTLILYGRSFLCELFVRWIQNLHLNIKVFICPSEDSIRDFNRQWPSAIWIPLEIGTSFGKPEKNECVVKILQNHEIHSFTRFFLGNMLYCEQLSVVNRKDVKEYGDKVKKVLFLKLSPLSGSVFVNSVLDSHPNILFLGLTILGVNIWHIVKKVVNVPGEELTVSIINEIKYYFEIAELSNVDWLEGYQNVLKQYFQEGKMYSERDIFLAIYFAHYEFVHGIPLNEEAIIYMDLHSNMLMRDSVFSWLEQMGFEVILLEMIRTPFKRLGSAIKWSLYSSGQYVPIHSNTVFKLLHEISGENIDEEELKYPIIRIRFEDLKMYPRQVLKKLCNRLDIPWSDILLKTTDAGEKSVYTVKDEYITGFDLKPVFYTYDEFFDAFDKFRLDLIFREKNKAYDYSYVEKIKYPISLEEIGRLFEFPFCFEKFMYFSDKKEREKYSKRMKQLCTQLLYLEENKEKYAEHFRFGNYLEVEK